MGYSIIFETKIIKLSEGWILHLDRNGCNNDTEGRNKNEFTGTLYKYEGFKSYLDKFLQMERPEEGWELKIGSKYCTYYDYGAHLMRMLKRAISFDDFIKERQFFGKRIDGMEVRFEKELKTKKISLDEFQKLWYDNVSMSYRRIITNIYTEEEIISALEQKIPVEFYVGKRKRTA
jgi:hypothetical protein